MNILTLNEENVVVSAKSLKDGYELQSNEYFTDVFHADKVGFIYSTESKEFTEQ